MQTNLPTALCLAPMAGITDWPLRLLCYRMGADYACSEMVSAIGYLCAKPHNDTYRRLLAVHPEETNTACQLFGREPSVMGEAAAKVTELGRFRSLDINMGCPARKVTSSGEGSALLLDPERAFRIMEAVKRNTTLPVTVKTRLGYDEDSMNALELGRAAQALGLRWIALHGRTKRQQYAGTADWAAIGRLKSQLSIPVIANGDVFAPGDAARMLEETGADGVMIGRGAMGAPWLFREARRALAGGQPRPVSLTERVDTAVLHTRWMVDFKGERLGVMEMRKHVGHYISGLRGATAIRREVNFVTGADAMIALLQSLSTLEEE